MPGSKERQRRRARERYEREKELHQQRQRTIRKWSLFTLAAVVVIGLAVSLPLTLTGSPSHAAAKSSASASPTTSASAAAVTEPATHCTYTKSSAGQVKTVSLPPSAPDYKATYSATINTNLGPIDISLLNSKATCTVNSFAHLASAGFWNNTQCHRVSDSDSMYFLQCGDPTATASEKLSCSSATLGSGGPGYEFADENLKGATYPAGTVAMANTGSANTNGSQFFLVFKDTTSLSASYTPFGTITSGLDILQNVAKAGTSCAYSAGGGVPKEKVVIKSVTIHQS